MGLSAGHSSAQFEIIMKLLVLACLAALVSADAEAEADPYYLGSYGYGSYYRSPVVSPYVYGRRYGLSAPLQRTFVVRQPSAAPAPAIAQAQSSAPALLAKAVPANPAVPMATTNSLVSSQYHAQDEDKNFSFGYSNINSARHEAGNAYTGVTGSYTDGRHTVNYVADVYGFRRI